MVLRPSQDPPSMSSSHRSEELTVKRPISGTLFVALVLGVLVPVCALVTILYHTSTRGTEQIAETAEEELRARAFSHLVAIREIKKTQITDFFAERIADARVLGDNPFVHQAFKELDAALDAGGGRAGGRFRGHTNGRYDAPAEYVAVHDKYYPTFRYYMEQYGYHDLFLMCPDHGDVSFTVAKEADFGRSADEIDSSLRDVWRVAAKEGTVAISDTKPYAPSAGVPAQFMAAPIKEDDRIIGVVALQMSIDAITKIMGERSGMGKTGETYLVGSDKLMRSDPLLDPENHSVVASFRNPSTGSVDTEGSNAALRGEVGAKVIIDYNGNRVLSAYTPVDVLGTRWALLAEIDEAEAFGAVNKVKQIRKATSRSLAAWASGLSGLCLLSIVLLGRGVQWKIARPIRRMAQAAIAVAKGDLGVQVPAEGNSETGVLARAMNQMTADLNDIVTKINKAAAELETTSREQAMCAKSQATATAEMSTTATELIATSQQTAQSGTAVSKQAELAARECADGARDIQDAVQGIEGIRERVERIAKHMLGLSGKSQQISGVLDIINELSEQTNLLSLNASIEAAGAGEAGKRFAVVASEIRKLAERAAESTTEIRGLIDSIQETVNATIMATEEGTKAVEQGTRQTASMEGTFERIASQVAATSESAKAIEMANRQQSTALAQMDGAVKDIDTAARQSEVTSGQVQSQAQLLVEAATRFRTADRQEKIV